jgi:hypothetical protein
MPPQATSVAQPSMPPVGNSFTTTAATGVQLSKETGAPAAVPNVLGCVAVWVQNPRVTDAGVAQVDNVLIGWANPGLTNATANVKYPVSLSPGDLPYRVPVQSLDQVWIKPASNTPICKYWTERVRTDGL